MSVDDDSRPKELEWRVVRTLLEANQRSRESLESFYYHRHYRTDEDLADFEDRLQRAIDTHRSIQDELEELLDVVSETHVDDRST